MGEFNAWVLMLVWASYDSMIAFCSSCFRSGELANCSLVLLAACCFNVVDATTLPKIVPFT